MTEGGEFLATGSFDGESRRRLGSRKDFVFELENRYTRHPRVIKYH